MALAQEKVYTIDDIYALPDGERAELIDGKIYNMTPPKRIHQKLVAQLTKLIGNYIEAKDGDCDKDKITDKGCNGAPDWIVEIISPSTERMDYEIKLFKYRSAGVREYWIINPSKQTVMVYDFEHGRNTKQYSFDDTISGCIYQDLKINITNLL